MFVNMFLPPCFLQCVFESFVKQMMMVFKYALCVKCMSDDVLGQCTTVRDLKTSGSLFEWTACKKLG